ncbi:MAG: DUF2397 domain-containing protein [Propionibacteriaceae bacterium]|nr:DUF2397 domain-containing protein [Propionibacteriaceae bacterium]
MSESTTWSLLSLPGAVSAAGYLVGPLAQQYRLIVDVLEDQRQVTLTGVGFDELQQLLRARLPEDRAAELMDELALKARMDQLVEWGTCSAWQDRAETQEDFLRNRHRYQLSDAGYQLNTAVRRIESELGATSTAVLQAPMNLLERLRETVTALDDNDAEAASGSYSQLQNTLSVMSDAATEWQNRLAIALGGSPTEEKVTRLLETILTYAEMWGSGVDAWSAPIAAHLPQLREVADEQWRALALTRLGTGAPEPLLIDAITEMKADVDILAAWFSGSNPQSMRLRRQIRDAVAPVLKSHRALLAVGGTVSRKADLLRLADALESAATDADAYHLWCQATGLHSARHVADSAPEATSGHRRSIWDTEPVPISRRLRAQGARSLSGRAPNIVDRRATRAEARRRAQAEVVSTERAAASLATRSGRPLSELGTLNSAEADLLLTMISESRRYRPGNEPSEVTSADGRWLLRLTPQPGSAVLEMPGGQLVMANAWMEFFE